MYLWTYISGEVANFKYKCLCVHVCGDFLGIEEMIPILRILSGSRADCLHPSYYSEIGAKLCVHTCTTYGYILNDSL